MLCHNKQYLQRELHYCKALKEKAEDANAEFVSMLDAVAKELAMETKTWDKVKSIKKEFTEDYDKIIRNVTLNDETFGMTRGHFRQYMLWYCHGTSYYFAAGDPQQLDNEGLRMKEHDYTFGEIVKRTFKNKDGEIKQDEVILFQEEEFICDVLTMDDLRHATKIDVFARPTFVWIKDIESFEPKKYFMEREQLLEIISHLYGTG